MHFDFEAVLVLATMVAGLCAVWQRWRLQRWRLRTRKEQAKRDGEDSGVYSLGAIGVVRLLFLPLHDGEDTSASTESTRHAVPGGFVDFARSLFPVLLVVLIIRSFVAEPFRIPSQSMVPTLLQGDFILVSKAAYGIHLPVTHTEVMPMGAPSRGDVAVFRYPPDPSTDYIKRIVGLPGDHVRYTAEDELFINGEKVPYQAVGNYKTSGLGAVRRETLGTATHQVLIHEIGGADEGYETTVPDDHYFVLGDNRNRSRDSRYWGTVPEANLVGRAWLVWFHLDFEDLSLQWSRIGTLVH